MKISSLNSHSFNGWANGSRQALSSYVFANEPKLLQRAMRMADKLETMTSDYTIHFTQNILRLKTRNNGQTQVITAALPQIFVKKNGTDKYVRVMPKNSSNHNIVSRLKALEKFIIRDKASTQKTSSKLQKSANLPKK